VINIGSGVETTVNELYRTMAEAAGDRLEPDYHDARAGELLRSALDPSRASMQLGWKPWTTLPEGVAAVLRWFRDHDS
jgi:UDP-glucose 4-epimerase